MRRDAEGGGRVEPRRAPAVGAQRWPLDSRSAAKRRSRPALFRRERRAHQRDRLLDVFHDECRIEPKHPIAEPPKYAIAARIPALAPDIRGAIDFDDELCTHRA